MTDMLYAGLLRLDGTEPPQESGYRRIPVPGAKLPNALFGRQIVFPDVTAPGYGVVDKITVYVDESAPMYLASWDLPEPLDVHEGVIPIIANGRLLRGLEMQAQVTMQSADLCGF